MNFTGFIIHFILPVDVCVCLCVGVYANLRARDCRCVSVMSNNCAPVAY